MKVLTVDNILEEGEPVEDEEGRLWATWKIKRSIFRIGGRFAKRSDWLKERELDKPPQP